MISDLTLQFLQDLSKNNNKTWFETHRSSYEIARNNFAELIRNIIDRHGKNDTDIIALDPKKCLFRINRDIRFSKDKSPYKTNFGASIDREGKKSIYAGYYFHLEPGKSFIGGGLWMPQPPEMKKVRQEIDYCWKEFNTIIGGKKFRSVYGTLYNDKEVTLSKVPAGFDKDSPAAEHLKLKSWLALRQLSDDQLLSKDLLKISLESCMALMPLIKFINRSFD